MKEQYYGILGDQVSELEARNRILARKAAEESFVLLKNDDALPLQNKNIALYGMGARNTVKGGLGSGSVEERYSVNIEEGLKNAGYNITSQAWLDDYDTEYKNTYTAWHEMVESKLVGMTNPMEIIPFAHSYVYNYPSGRIIEDDDIRVSDTDTAVYVIMRQAGECNDRRLEKGDYLLTDIETENLKIIAKAYKHTILIINIGGVVDLSILDEVEGIDAVVSFVQGGEEGGNALADVLSGKSNFSGKLTDTWQISYDDVPSGENFSYLNGNLKEEDYVEGIYVGYRYYDTFQKEVRFPFGYGLSYTDFVLDTNEVQIEGTKIVLNISAENTGKEHSGKEVVQVYISSPTGMLKKEYQSLVAFKKTKKLSPREKENLKISIELEDLASYDEQSSRWILEAGEYIIRVGNQSRNTIIAAVLNLDKTVITKQCVSCCMFEDKVEEIEAPIPLAIKEELIGVKRIEIKATAFQTVVVDYTEPEVVETEQEKMILNQLTIEEIAELLQGGALQNPPAGVFEIIGAGGKTTTSLLDKGIKNIILSDGPAGINISNQVCFGEDGSVKPVRVPERYNWGILAKAAAQKITSTVGTIVSRYATAWPVELLLAQSWNTDLLTEVGRAVGEEMEQFGITLWLAPGMNIHRNPLCGRNFEYYSEDPFISGKMAAAITSGVQSKAGIGTTIKHFCCNNTEDNRIGSSSNVNERALREIYLKGFEIAVKESQPLAVMSSYNMLNGKYTANNYELLTKILRCEWGFEGLVMTDWGSCGEENGRPEECAPAGNDLIMAGSDYDREQIRSAIKAGTVTKEQVRRCACRVLRVMLQANTPVLFEN